MQFQASTYATTSSETPTPDASPYTAQTIYMYGVAKALHFFMKYELPRYCSTVSFYGKTVVSSYLHIYLVRIPVLVSTALTREKICKNISVTALQIKATV